MAVPAVPVATALIVHCQDERVGEVITYFIIWIIYVTMVGNQNASILVIPTLVKGENVFVPGINTDAMVLLPFRGKL